MAKQKLDEIKQKKIQLEKELAEIQDELDHSLDEVRSDVSHKLQPTEFIRNHPLPVFGLSVLIGFLAGHKRRVYRETSDTDSSKDGISSILWKELKKLATRKAVSMATDYVDNMLGDKNENLSSSTNGSTTQND